ncbi:MAG TPA: sugar phosphate nucleotidyltransferase [Elusimicrobiota bacterium]|nr:sugar phosphate nucleotidyltransferase [Elusimicrobiota bacterium]
MTRKSDSLKRWAVVLAGGDGQRMEAFIRRWLGHPRPKQYCAFSGLRTMLEHTVDRARGVVSPSRIVTVINTDHRRYVEEPRRLDIAGRIIEQPRRCDTGPGVFLPLTHVMAQDPEALVAIMPSDHFIHPIDKFSALVNEAFLLAADMPDKVILLSARPDSAESDYGWISPGEAIAGRGAMLVERFKEKPQAAEAAELHRRGGLWNTMIMVARVSALWDIARKSQPAMIKRFDELRPWMGRAEQDAAVARAYAAMESVNFSRDIVEPAAARMAVMPMEGIHWSDWGRPQRIAETLSKIGKTQAFPAEIAEEQPRRLEELVLAATA